jgi:hypothetical protein
MVDAASVKLLPTWRNGRRGRDYIAKRLDRFLIDEKLVDSGMNYRSWVCNVKISDHMPVILHLEAVKDQVKYPFKFNLVWLDDPEFVALVRSNWNGLLGTEVLNPMDSLVKKIKLLKMLVIVWERKKKVADKAELVQLEFDLESLYSESPGGFVLEEEKDWLWKKKKGNCYF